MGTFNVATASKTINLRVYKVTLKRRGNQELCSFDDPDLVGNVENEFDVFVNDNLESNKNSELERTWYFGDIEKDTKSKRVSALIHYGTYGFASRIVDGMSRKEKFRRSVSDSEEIPLYFDAYFPEGQDFALFAFQSFQGRSCISLLISTLKEHFEIKNRQFLLRFEKVAPTGAHSGSMKDRDVKEVRLIRKKAVNHLEDYYASGASSEEVNLELSIKARRRGTLGKLGDLVGALDVDGLLLYEGIQFEQATAMVKVGKKRQRVGVFGTNQEFGTMDITEDVEWNPVDGHPTRASLKSCCDEILEDFYNTLAVEE